MHPIRTRLVLGALIVVIVAALLLLVDFQAATSASIVESSVSKFTVGATASTRFPPPASLCLVVSGGSELHAYLEKELVQGLRSAPGIGEVTPIDSADGEKSCPTLLVEASPDVLTWTPVYSSARGVARLIYASDGDLSWRNDKAVVMSNRDGSPQVRVRGDLKLGDTTRGIMSRPAYQRHLAHQIALAASDVLKKQVYDTD